MMQPIMVLDVGRESRMFSVARPTSTERGMISMTTMMLHMLAYLANYTHWEG